MSDCFMVLKCQNRREMFQIFFLKKQRNILQIYGCTWCWMMLNLKELQRNEIYFLIFIILSNLKGHNRIKEFQKSFKEIAKMTKKSALKRRHKQIGKLLVSHQLKSILTHQPFLSNLKLKSIKSWMLIRNENKIWFLTTDQMFEQPIHLKDHGSSLAL